MTGVFRLAIPGVLLAVATGCDAMVDDAAPGFQHGPAVPPPAGSVPLGGREPPPDEDALEDVENPAPDDRMTGVRGAQAYAVHCAPCHGSRGRGDGPIAELLSEAPPDLTDPELQSDMKDGALFHVITAGSMSEIMPPAQADLPPAERWALVRHLRSLKR